MVRFSCFQGHILSPKHKKAVLQSTEAMQKTLEDSSQKQALRNSSDLNTENKSCLKEEGNTHYYTADHATDYSPTEHDCRSEEMDGKESTEYDIKVHDNAQMRKCQSEGSGLNWEERTSAADGSEEEMEQRFSDDGSGDRSRTVLDSVDNNGIIRSDQFQDPLPSESVQVDSDVAKNMSIFSIGDPEQTLEESADKDDIDVSGEHGSGDVTPHTGHVIVKSRSLPRLGSPKQCSASFLARPRSAEDMSTLDSWKKGMDGVGRQVRYQERHNSVHNDDENTGENPADDTDENYNYVGSSKDWIIPMPNNQKDIKGDTSVHHWDELPAKDFRIKRIENWVINIQHCGPLEESNESAPCYDQESRKANALLEEPALSKVDDKVSPGMVAAKRYISSLNASATAAQLSNLGLHVIPFLSAFGSLKALNLSGNAIVRIAAGALPRGLHILNLSKNNISTIEGLRDLTRLRVLDLSYNRILRIGHGLGACSSIKELYLAGNKISEVEGLHRLLKLNVLDLRFNKISTTKCLGQLAANYNSLQALSLEGNPAQKNVGDEQLKKYVLSLLPNLTYYNRHSIKVGTTKDAVDRSARMSSHQIDRGHRLESKPIRKASHSMVVQKGASSSSHGRKGQAVASPKSTRGRHGRLPPSGMKTTAVGHQFDISSKVQSLRADFSFPRSRSEGNLGAL
ncbi:hypothetical protein C2S53_017995 [Perilla frutescens var. hirtella]|uniref:Uncharacterized protein n=1 Tax=Perilla frutescens var. hirtella TaxID=608512 RepID=A0AAD4JJA2_PERFH|nr:hypothetical protein C2S53_017995 [Perilla frutescens var. hirtella]